MRDLRRLLKYLLPHTGSFIIATIAMVVVALLEAATGALVVPIFSQSSCLAHDCVASDSLHGNKRHRRILLNLLDGLHRPVVDT